MTLFGHTRTVVSKRHALIAPDGHVPSTFPGWVHATGFVMISPAMGANFAHDGKIRPQNFKPSDSAYT